jgi:hypothetical protein
MANTPKAFTPKARAERMVAAPAATGQMPQQAAAVLQQASPPSVQAASPAPEPVAEAAADIDPDLMAAIAARRAHAPKVGSSKMAIPPRVGWVRRWFNDSPGRIAMKQQQGWAICKNPETGESWMMVVNNSITEAGGLKGYVMEIPLQFYNEDQDAKQKNLDAIDAQIYGGTYNEEPDDKRYVPKSTPIKVETRVGPGSG